MTDTQTPSGEPGAALPGAARFRRPGTPVPDLRSAALTGGREVDALFPDRSSHHGVARATGGVNCTGSCRGNVYVKDGIITKET